jgi:hypothetical protein
MQPELCSQAKLRGVLIPEKMSVREVACLNAKSFLAGMAKETREVWTESGMFSLEFKT